VSTPTVPPRSRAEARRQTEQAKPRVAITQRGRWLYALALIDQEWSFEGGWWFGSRNGASRKADRMLARYKRARKRERERESARWDVYEKPDRKPAGKADQ
jgi:hypothetical protein